MRESCSYSTEVADGSHVQSAPNYHNCNMGSCWGEDLVTLKASAAVSENGVPTADVAVVV